MFDSLGLAERTLSVYRALLQRPELIRPSMLAALCAELQVTEGAASAELDLLRGLGLLVPRWSVAGEEYPLHPAVGFERLTAKRQQELDDLTGALRHDQLAASHFVADYDEFLAQRNAADVEVLEGRDKAYQRMQHFQPTKSVWAILPPPYQPPSWEPADSPDMPFLERGVDARSLLAESILKTPGWRRHFDHQLDFGAQFRVVPAVPPRLIIFDGESAVMGIDPDDQSVGAVVHHGRAVVRQAEELFLSYWNRAVDPFTKERRARQGDISDQERAFLGLLVQGATDEQVGRKLGVSMRTVRRMAAKLSEQVGASGRFELGVRAAQRRWVE